MKTEKTISEFINQHLLADGTPVNADTELFTSGLLDSFHLVELLLFLETTFKIKIKPNEIVPELINTPRAITTLINKKTATQ